MKIGIDGRSAKWYRGTGIGTYTYQLISCLNKIDAYNKYMIFMPENSNMSFKFRNNFNTTGITENCSNNFWDEVNIPNILKGKDIELYHVPQNGVGLPEEKTCNFIITLHDVIPYKMPETTSEKYLKIFNEKIPNIVSKCDGIITVSEYSKKDIINTFDFPEDKIFVTYLASEDMYHPIDKNLSKNLIKKFYSIEDDYILYIGGFSPRKNIVGLIESFSKLTKLYKRDIKLIIAGKKGNSYSIYKKRSEELNISDKVIFPGFIPLEHLPYLYNAAKLFVYPSFYEGFGLPPVEAMACGIPVITSNLTSIPEVVGDSAILINPYDIDSLTNSMYEALLNENLRNSLIQKGLIRTSQLSWNITAKNTIAAYTKTLNAL